MSLPVVAIRPEPGCSATVAAGRAQGLDVLGCPLFEIRPRAWQPPPVGEIDALLLGSANAVRHAGADLTQLRGLPAYAVGEATAQAAREAGFAIAAIGGGGLQSLLERTVRAPLRLLRLAGEEHVPLTPPVGVELATRIVYGADALPLPGGMARLLAAGAVVLLHSAAAARHFAAECDRIGISRQAVFLAALGPRIAAAAGGTWKACSAVAEPSDAALLALAAHMCHARPGREEP